MKIVNHTDLSADFFECRRLSETAVTQTVLTILESVRTRGDEAVREYSQRFDRAAPETTEIDKKTAEIAAKQLKKENSALYNALCYSRDMTFRFAQEQTKCFFDFETRLADGVITGQKIIPVERAGVYVPGGRYPLISSVIMGVIPAKAAGVREVIFCSPPDKHPETAKHGAPWIDERILAAAFLCGADRIFAAGGAQAIAAMAYGTQSIPRTDVIVGPGNKYVAEAKKLVYGDVGIDLVAGPTEVLIIADDSAHPDWIAADLLAQAEHDADAQAVLVTVSASLAEAVVLEIEKQLKTLSTAATARESLEKHGLIILTETFDQAAEIANRKAPEHLELALGEGAIRSSLEKKLHNYGSLFVGHRSAEVLGDYAAGLNHTLPTAGAARFTGGLSVRHFLKTVTVLRTEPECSSKKECVQKKQNPENTAERTQASFVNCLRAAETLGQAEGLAAHAAAAVKRLI